MSVTIKSLKTQLCVLLLSLLATQGYGQLHNYNFVKSKIDKSTVITENEKYYFHLEKNDSKSKLITVLKESSEIVYTVDFKKEFSITATPKFVSVKNNEICFFYAFNNSNRKELTYFVLKLNIDDGKLIKKVHKVIPDNPYGIISAWASPNNEHFLLFSACSDPEKSKIFVLDNGFNHIFTAKANYKFIHGQQPYARIDNDGSVIFFDEKSINVFDANKDYDLWQESVNLKALDTTSMSGGKVYDLQLSFDKMNNLIVLGHYIPSTSKHYASHIMTMRINGVSHEIDYIKLAKLSGNWDKAVLVKEQKRMIVVDDGGYLFIEEKVDAYSNYNNIQVYRFNENGDLLWKNKINKRTKFSLKEQKKFKKHMGFSAHYQDDELSILYNTHKDNLSDPKNDNIVTNKKGIILAACSFNIKDGNRKEDVILSREDMKKIKNIGLPKRSYYSKNGDEIFIRTGVTKYSMITGLYHLKKQKSIYINR